jgi:hypothetical protein
LGHRGRDKDIRRMKKFFTEHPESVGETYWQHLWTATTFGARLMGAGIACFIHALFPFLFKSHASKEICSLHDRMISSRSRHVAGTGQAAEHVS